PRSRQAAGFRSEFSPPIPLCRRGRPAPKRASGVRRAAVSSADLDAIVLDDRIGEELLGGVFQRALGPSDILGFELDVEHLALAHARDPWDAERLERAFDRLPLRIEHAGFQCYGDASAQRPLRMTPTCGKRPGAAWPPG